jgi:uncharacterized protein YabN with tetrapyrrole methylase and pyrophosphatase domain
MSLLPPFSEAVMMSTGIPLHPDVLADDSVDIYIVGLGILHPNQITREVEAALCRSNEVLFVERSDALESYLATISTKLTDLATAAYQEGADRLEAYDTMAAMVIDAALDHPPVTFALYGHPLIFAYPPFQILQIAPLLNLRVKILPGISALDCLFVDLKLDPAQQGLQIYEATDLLLRRRPLQPDVPCLLWQIGVVETRLYTEGVSRPQRFERIKRYLLEHYPPDHEVVAVYSTKHPLLQSSFVRFALEDIETHADELHQGMTLYIPAVRQRPIADHELLELTGSVLHLREVATRD